LEIPIRRLNFILTLSQDDNLVLLDFQGKRTDLPAYLRLL